MEENSANAQENSPAVQESSANAQEHSAIVQEHRTKSKSIYIGGMTCSACEKLISKAVESVGGKVHSIDSKSGVANIDYPKGAEGELKKAIETAGYELLDPKGRVPAAEPFEQEIRVFASRLLSGDRALFAERKLLAMSVMSLVLIAFVGFFAYLFVLRNLPGIGARFPFLAYGALSAVALTASMAHYHSHRKQFTCMEGMMVGMTIGMMGGFLFGAVIGATNGMFVGSVFGMAVGMVAGAYCGKCCGIMGVMEGMMAGIMSGTMGAMLTVMMLADRLELFMPIFVGSCLALLAGLTYMIYVSAGRREEGQLMQFSSFAAIAFLLAALTAAVMFFGPKGPITV